MGTIRWELWLLDILNVGSSTAGLARPSYRLVICRSTLIFRVVFPNLGLRVEFLTFATWWPEIHNDPDYFFNKSYAQDRHSCVTPHAPLWPYDNLEECHGLYRVFASYTCMKSQGRDWFSTLMADCATSYLHQRHSLSSLMKWSFFCYSSATLRWKPLPEVSPGLVLASSNIQVRVTAHGWPMCFIEAKQRSTPILFVTRASANIVEGT